MKLLCKKSIKLSPFDEIFESEFYEINIENETITVSGRGMSGPSWFELDPPSGRHDTRLENYFYSLEETRNILINNLLNK